MGKSRKQQFPPAMMIQRPGITVMQFQHDNDCKTIKTQSMNYCTCDPVVVFKTGDQWLKEMKEAESAA